MYKSNWKTRVLALKICFIYTSKKFEITIVDLKNQFHKLDYFVNINIGSIYVRDRLFFFFLPYLQQISIVKII